MGCAGSKAETHDDTWGELDPSERTVMPASEREAVSFRDIEDEALRLNAEAKETEEAGHFDDARALYERALELMSSTSGMTVPYATTLSNMACLLRTQKRYDEALELFTEALDMVENYQYWDSFGGEDSKKELVDQILQNKLQMEIRSGVYT
jgi:tetratricopeptide (TPR) repeat protein